MQATAPAKCLSGASWFEGSHGSFGICREVASAQGGAGGHDRGGHGTRAVSAVGVDAEQRRNAGPSPVGTIRPWRHGAQLSDKDNFYF
ncbi:hypothetical protein [Methylobacterium sp. Leaf108]|uniref:hypothetical protein n=1 Tax=Methylobacterium sp. Leaf108 TaxID=1736256 RepID=UPI0006FE112E|nr:hypothetical protein [Methylobacterium sp. Leaf108]KQP51968.1 hypothetical protein ASF39_09490 [Methylobacterium sp. Leaf108]